MEELELDRRCDLFPVSAPSGGLQTRLLTSDLSSRGRTVFITGFPGDCGQLSLRTILLLLPQFTQVESKNRGHTS